MSPAKIREIRAEIARLKHKIAQAERDLAQGERDTELRLREIHEQFARDIAKAEAERDALKAKIARMTAPVAVISAAGGAQRQA